MSVRDALLTENPEAILLGKEFDPALIGIVHPVYVHHPDVFVAAYDLQKIEKILWEQTKLEYPDEDEDTLSVYCTDAYWELLEFMLGDHERRKHLPLIIQAIDF
jgi:hypothetical protein